MADVYSLEDLEARVAKMRALGVTKWGDIELGPEPPPAESGETQRTSPPDEVLRTMRAEKQRVASLASGGPVKSAGRPQ